MSKHPRFLADLTGDGRADIVGFGDGGVWVSLNNGNGTFAAPKLVVTNFAYTAGGWRVDKHPRFLANLTNDHSADIVGFGNEGVWESLNSGNGTFGKGFVRKEIWALEAGGPWDAVTLAYAKAIKVLQSRPATNPTSWTYLSAVHGTTAAVPAGAVWNQCQHGSWWFLPWHRMYVYYFERIVRAEVIKAGGPSDWALPFWDYEQGGPRRFHPRSVNRRCPTEPPTRCSSRNDHPGSTPGTATVLGNQQYSRDGFTVFTPPPSPGFGGGKTSPQHFFGATGELEFTPHNIVHSLIGGWMGDPDTAASDPIFWLHHCNIDRLWEVWLKKAGGRVNPPDAQWRTTPFIFHDETGAQVQLTATDILNTATQLGYTYQGVTASAVASLAVAEGVDERAVADEVEPDMVGASERPTVLAGADATVDIAIDQRALTARATVSAADATATPARVYLSIEDVEAEKNPETAYEVYISVPDKPGAVPQYVGNVSFFGIQHLSGVTTRDDEPHGFRRVFDITSGCRGVAPAGSVGRRAGEGLVPSGFADHAALGRGSDERGRRAGVRRSKGVTCARRPREPALRLS